MSLNGTQRVIFISTDQGTTWRTVCFATDLSITRSMATRDITTKQSEGNRQLLGGLRQWSISTSGLVAFDVDQRATPADLKAIFDGRTKVWVEVFDQDLGEAELVGQVRKETFDSEAPVEENMTYSITLEGDGVVTDTWPEFWANYITSNQSNRIVSAACLLALMQELFEPTYN